MTQRKARAEHARERDDHGDERRRREVTPTRAELAARFGGTLDPVTVLETIERARAHKARLTDVDRLDVDPDRRFRGPTHLAGGEGATVKVTPARRNRVALAGTRRFVTVTAKRPFPAATLRFKVTPKDVRHLVADTLVVARWDEASGRFRGVPPSGYNRRLGYAYARITRPGVYSLVGVPRDPRVATTMRLQHDLRDWLPFDGTLHFTPKVCGLILCARGNARPVPTDAARFGFDLADFVGGPGGANICDLCLGRGGPGDLGILDILDTIGFRERPPIPPPSRWPQPCRPWHSVGPDNVPGRIRALAVDPTDGLTMYAGSAAGGVFKTLNGGVYWMPTWETELSLAIGGLAVAPSDPKVLYAATGEWDVSVSAIYTMYPGVGVYRSGDAGATWHRLAPISSVMTSSVAVDPADPDRLFVAGDHTDNWFSNLLKTVNGGDVWQAEIWNDLGIDTSNLNLEALSIGWIHPTRLLAITRTNGAVARSTTGGGPWTTVLSVAGEEISAVTFAPSDDDHAYAASASGRVWHSVDGGATWTELARAGLPTARVHDIEVDWDDPLRVFLAFGTRGALAAVGYRQLWRGAVGAGALATWFDVSGGLPALSLPDLGLTGLALDPVLDDTIYVSNIVGVYRSTDGGASWHPFDEGLPNCFVSDLDMRKVDRTLWVSTMGRGAYRRAL